jgi:hypothetical protein
MKKEILEPEELFFPAKSCGTCKFSRHTSDKQTGQCRHSPPFYNPNESMGDWPRVYLVSGWCGQHEEEGETTEVSPTS